jgi:predicted nuclease of predicted toxin-antitoxin system
MDRARDSEILDVARRDSRIVITADLDFPRILALSSAEGPGLTLLRGGNYSDSEMRDLLERVLEECHLIPWRPLSAWWTDDVSDAPACH